MKTVICFAAGLLAAIYFGSGTPAFSANADWAKVQQDAKTALKAQKQKHGRGHGSGAFSHWCAYNCHAVPRHGSRRALGRYGYSAYAYDEDLPFRHPFDCDASLTDNLAAVMHPLTGEPRIRLFERVY
jgi:hypothetical protein